MPIKPKSNTLFSRLQFKYALVAYWRLYLRLSKSIAEARATSAYHHFLFVEDTVEGLKQRARDLSYEDVLGFMGLALLWILRNPKKSIALVVALYLWRIRQYIITTIALGIGTVSNYLSFLNGPLLSGGGFVYDYAASNIGVVIPFVVFRLA